MIAVEADTITAALAGDREALGRVLQSCHRALSLHLSERIGSPYRAAIAVEEVIQVTFVEAFLRIGDLKERTAEGLLSWLKSVAGNNLIDAIRALGARKRPPQTRRIGSTQEESVATFLASLAGSDTTPTQGARRLELTALLEQAFSQLPPDYAAAVRLYDLEGKTIEEVAAAFDPPKTTGAVHMLRARAKDRLRELLGDTSKYFSGSA